MSYVTGKIKETCMWCGLTQTIESTPYKVFKEIGTHKIFAMRFCKKCKEKHAHEIIPEIKETT